MNHVAVDFQWTGEKIREVRQAKGWSQQELADKVGCRMQTVSEWETGKYLPQNAYQKILSLILRK